MYIKIKEFLENGIKEDEILLLSLNESITYKTEIKGVSLCINIDGSEPQEQLDV